MHKHYRQGQLADPHNRLRCWAGCQCVRAVHVLGCRAVEHLGADGVSRINAPVAHPPRHLADVDFLRCTSARLEVPQVVPPSRADAEARDRRLEEIPVDRGRVERARPIQRAPLPTAAPPGTARPELRIRVAALRVVVQIEIRRGACAARASSNGRRRIRSIISVVPQNLGGWPVEALSAGALGASKRLLDRSFTWSFHAHG
jgi:hypothetical protein